MSIGSRLRDRLSTEPKRYQIQAVRAIEKADGRFILGDDMGLGKTLESIGWLAIHPEIQRVVVVCPAGVKYQWQDQLLQHAKIPSVVAEGRNPKSHQLPFIVINYTILASCATWPKGKRKAPLFPWVEELKKIRPQLVIIDECHFIKEQTALRTKAVQQLVRSATYVIGASGTPVDKAPVEFFNILQLVAPTKFRSFWRYVHKYCAPRRAFKNRGWDFSGADNLEELHHRIQPHMIRRLKKDVAKELPPKIRSVLPVSLTNEKEYDKAAHHYLDWVESNSGKKARKRASTAIQLTKLGALKRIAAEGKLTAIRSWAKIFLTTGRKLIIFCVHRRIFSELVKQFPSCASIAGGSQRRHEEVRRFQTDPDCRIFVGQLRATGVGLDGLHHVASDALFAEVGWGWDEHEQAEDRILRIGQTSQTVNIFYMVGRNTVEETTLELLQSKHDIRQQILEGSTDITQLFPHPNKERKS